MQTFALTCDTKIRLVPIESFHRMILTVFTCDDLHSKRVVNTLVRRNISFKQISLVEYPQKLEILRQITSNTSCPQVFLNSKFLGGADSVLKELDRLERDIQAHISKAAASRPSLLDSSQDKVIAGIKGNSTLRRLLAAESEKENHASEQSGYGIIRCYDDENMLLVNLPDGTRTTVLDIMEKLRHTQAMVSEVKQPGTSLIYLRCFTGTEALNVFEHSLKIDRTTALAFASHLVDAKVIVPIKDPRDSAPDSDANSLSTSSADTSHSDGSDEDTVEKSDLVFKDSEKHIYRLQCHATPDILNSYCVWPTSKTARKCEAVIAELDEKLREIENNSLDGDGRLDHEKVRSHQKFPAFEEAVCELQWVVVNTMDGDGWLASGLNLYQLMIRYALVKIGVFDTEVERLNMQLTIKFNLAGNIYTFQEWVDGILRANTRTRFSKSRPLDKDDPRLSLAIQSLDYRIHFALNVGYWMGSRASLPFKRFSASNVGEELDIAARVFCADDSNISIQAKKNEFHLAAPLLWHVHDLRRHDDDKEVIRLLFQYMPNCKKFSLQKRFQQNNSIRLRPHCMLYTRNISNFTKYNETAVKTQHQGCKSAFWKFKLAPKPANELLRLTTVHRMGVLDTLPEERFDRLTRMVQITFKIPFVFVMLVDEHRVWVKSRQWDSPSAPIDHVPRELAFCSHTVVDADADGIFEVTDLAHDDRFARNPVVLGPLQPRYYCGNVISVQSNDSAHEAEWVNIGTLCMIDTKPRQLDNEQRKLLQEFRELVKEELLLQRGKQVSDGQSGDLELV